MKVMMRKYLPLLTALLLILSACTSPLEVARRTAQADRTPTATPDLAAPAVTPQPGGSPTQNPDQSVNGQPPCSGLAHSDSLPTVLWDNLRQQYRLLPVDPQNGYPLCGSTPIPFEQYVHQAVSPDGNMLASFNYRDEYFQNGSLSLVNLNSWQVVTTTVKVDAEINSMVFNPAGDLLAFALHPKPGTQPSSQSPLFLYDVKSGQITDSTLLDFIPRSMHFTANGKWLAIYGSTQGGDTEQLPAAYALLLWTNHLGLAWRQELNILDGSSLVGPKDQEKTLVTWSPGLVYSPQRDLLYIVSANEEKFTIVDYINRSVEAKIIQPARSSWLDQLFAMTASPAQARAMWGLQKQAVLSADGGRLYVTGLASGTQPITGQPGQPEGPFGLQVIDIKTTSQVAHLDTKAVDIQTSPDGKYLFLRSWDGGTPSTDVLLASTLEAVAHLPAQSLIATHTFAGKVIILAIQESLTESQVSLLDSTKFNTLYTWTASGKPLWIKM